MNLTTLYPNFMPRITEPMWFDIDPPVNESEELDMLEAEYENWCESIARMDSDVIPVGSLNPETPNEVDGNPEGDPDNEDDDDDSRDEEEEEEDDDDDDDIDMLMVMDNTSDIEEGDSPELLANADSTDS